MCSRCETVCGSKSFISFLQSFITIGQNLGNKELVEVFPKSSNVFQNIEMLKNDNQRELYAKFRSAFKTGWCSMSLYIKQVLCGEIRKSVLFMRIQYLEADISAIKNKVIFASTLDLNIGTEIFLSTLLTLFNDFGGHEEDLMRLTIVTDNQPMLIDALNKFRRKSCVADIITDILKEAFSISAVRETKEFLSTCRGIVSVLLTSDKHNIKVIQDDGTWISKFLMVQTVTERYNDIPIILERESISYPTANKVLLWWTAIKDHLNTSQNYSYELIHIMINASDCFRLKFVLTMDNKLDCFYDPRYRMLKMLDERERSEVEKEVKKRLEGIITDESVLEPASKLTVPEIKKARFSKYETKKGDSRMMLPKKQSNKSLNAKKMEDQFKRFETNDDENVNQNDEVVKYLKLPALKSSQCESEFDTIIKFWKSQQKNLPKLHSLATSRLHIPATCGCFRESTCSQKLFTTDDNSLKDLLFIKDKLEPEVSNYLPINLIV